MSAAEPITIATDVLVIGSGAAGMYAAIEAARRGSSVLLADRSLIGRGGATVMAQMTVAVALGEETPDDPRHHFDDTIAAGRGLCDEALAQLLCEDAPDCIRELDRWGVGWARKDGHITAAQAPGHDRPRCVYVDFISTGPAVSKTLRAEMARHHKSIRKAGDLCVVDLIVHDGAVGGAIAWHLSSGAPVVIAAKSTVLATGGLTRLFARNSASANMGGDGYALALRAGAQLIDMEFLQFFPIGHLAPRLVGLDPIMWDPFRYKLGGILLNGAMEPFEERYADANRRHDGQYILTRDLATYAITQEVEAGRGSPAGGAFLSFRHIPEAELRRAFGPIIDTLAKNGIDLTQQPIEVSPIAHYHMGGVRVDTSFATAVPNLFAAGEAVGGANGANRLSGNGITEALAFGARAGESAAKLVRTSPAQWTPGAVAPALDMLAQRTKTYSNPAELIVALQVLMTKWVGPFRTAARLDDALAAVERMTADISDVPMADGAPFDRVLLDWLDLRNMLLVAKSVILGAIARSESRGAHQREDFPGADDAWLCNQVVTLKDGALCLDRMPVAHASRERVRVPA